MHELLIDLHDIDRESAQIAERRMARAEVVDGDAHAHVAQLLQRRDGAVAVLHGRAFRDLDDQILG